MRLTASEFLFNLLKVICDCVVVILLNEIDQTVNFAQICIKYVEASLKI